MIIDKGVGPGGRRVLVPGPKTAMFLFSHDIYNIMGGSKMKQCSKEQLLQKFYVFKFELGSTNRLLLGFAALLHVLSALDLF
jgi:hypothetical protein